MAKFTKGSLSTSYSTTWGLPTGSGDWVLSPSWEDPREGNGNPLQYFCPENPMDRGAWRAIVYEAAEELDTTQQQNNNVNNSVTHFRFYDFI